MSRIMIFDYGAGNLFSIKHALEKNGVETIIKNKFVNIKNINGLILPGVGNFKTAANKLVKVKKQINELKSEGIPMLGICLGMQLFFNNSEEGGGQGLSLFDGKIMKLPKTVKVPQIGWNKINITKNKELVDGLEDNAWAYFVHSYYPKISDEKIEIANTTYGTKFPSIVGKDNIYGTQFHPEKSDKMGMRIIQNFVDICRR